MMSLPQRYDWYAAFIPRLRMLGGLAVLLFGSGQLAAIDEPKANLEDFRKTIGPVLKAACVGCHGQDKQKAKFRVDTLDPDLLKVKDVSWWLEVQGVLTNGEMPPPDSDVKLADADRVKVIDWLAGEIRAASEARDAARAAARASAARSCAAWSRSRR